MIGSLLNPPKSLVLVHGAGSGPWVYDGWADAFPRVVTRALDLQEGLDVAHASHDDYARKVVAAASMLPAPVALCGWSMGGLVVLQAAQSLRPHSLVLLEASAPAEVQGAHPEIPIGTGSFDPEEVYGAFPAGMPARQESQRARDERKRGIHVPSLPCRALIVYGEAFPEDRGAALADFYNAEMRAFPGLDHWDLVRKPEVRAAVALWLGIGVREG